MIVLVVVLLYYGLPLVALVAFGAAAWFAYADVFPPRFSGPTNATVVETEAGPGVSRIKFLDEAGTERFAMVNLRPDGWWPVHVDAAVTIRYDRSNPRSAVLDRGRRYGRISFCLAAGVVSAIVWGGLKMAM
ncbi:MAG TPA: hypothetical protein VKU19_21430 [Bryobacteraceae bacterium]|nr:hypothetical protein [Bryobacteraceae bacterium]